MKKQQEKKQIRSQYLQRRASFSEQQVTMKSRAVLEHLKSFEPIGRVVFIHCYLSIADRGEIDTFDVIGWLLTENKKVAVPKSDFKTKNMQHYLISNLESLTKNHLGIPEPAGGVEISDDQLDLIIVPMVAADSNKNRLGYGEGFYDRFLARTNAVKIGLVYENCLMEDPLPVEEFDISMDYLVTEKRIL
ncbi:MAG: 5-formyltetrahydrofolate cyclo-ligase [Balneolaceae bacterium]